MGKLSLLGLELILLFHILYSSTTSIWSEATTSFGEPAEVIPIPENSNHEYHDTLPLQVETLVEPTSEKNEVVVVDSPTNQTFSEDKGKNHSSSNLKLTENVKNETEPISPVWGGNCTETNWKGCSSLKTYFSAYIDPNDPKKEVKYYKITCSEQKVLCLKNGWTVTRCQILCMGKCNRDMMSKYDEYVAKEEAC